MEFLRLQQENQIPSHICAEDMIDLFLEESQSSELLQHTQTQTSHLTPNLFLVSLCGDAEIKSYDEEEANHLLKP